MSESNPFTELYNEFPTMDSFLDKFPILKNYITNTDSYGEQIVRLNIVIANIRNILGWKYDSTFSRHITDVKTSKNMYELAIRDANPLLELILKCMVHILWVITEDALCSPIFIEDENVSINLGELKNKIYSYACRESIDSNLQKE
jgi:hypothetical protein